MSAPFSPLPSRTSASEPPSLAQAHARFARAALLIYLGAAAVAFSLLIVALLTDKAHNEDLIRERLLLATDVRAHSLGQHLGLLVEELQRLSLRSEIDLLDQDLSPERSLLQLSHEKSTFFNLGVAIISRKGAVLCAEPQDFLAAGTLFTAEPWFSEVRRSRSLKIVPVQPDKPDAVLYVVTPLTKDDEFVGALLGGVDLARGETLANAAGHPLSEALTVLATQQGEVIYPPGPPAFSGDLDWKELFTRRALEPFTENALLSGAASVVAASPVSGTDLVLMSVATQSSLFQAARARLYTRLLLGLVLAASPLVLLVVLLQRSLALFRHREQDAVRAERMRLLGEAASSIAHEVKNALNGLGMGLDLLVRRDERPEALARRERIALELRKEMQRLTEFTTELMTFSKGIDPRRARLDLAEFVPKVTGLVRDAAVERGASIDLTVPRAGVFASADPVLLHAVISNLAGNALDAITGKGGPAEPRVEVILTARDGRAELRVRDNGPGVSASMRGRLFEPFQTEKPNGVGIGLALAKKIALAHGGDLVLEDSPEPGDAASSPEPRGPRGASFLLTLPLEDA